MPTLNWIGKKAVENNHRQVPFHLLKEVPELSVGDPGSGNVNSPEIREWLGKVVGKEMEDLTRHDKWLCMMYPRLSLLKEFLREDGSIWISIDDAEIQHLRNMMDEIFGRDKFVATNVWQKRYSRENRESSNSIWGNIKSYGGIT